MDRNKCWLLCAAAIAVASACDCYSDYYAGYDPYGYGCAYGQLGVGSQTPIESLPGETSVPVEPDILDVVEGRLLALTPGVTSVLTMQGDRVSSACSSTVVAPDALELQAQGIDLEVGTARTRQWQVPLGALLAVRPEFLRAGRTLTGDVCTSLTITGDVVENPEENEGCGEFGLIATSTGSGELLVTAGELSVRVFLEVVE